MMSEAEWWETAVTVLRTGGIAEFARLLELYKSENVSPERPPEVVAGYLKDIVKRLRGELPPFMVMAAGDFQVETPDDVWMEPAWNDLEVEVLWGKHDGRSYGTMVVAVYKWDAENQSYTRDMNWGIMGSPGKTGPAGDEEKLCSDC